MTQIITPCIEAH